MQSFLYLSTNLSCAFTTFSDFEKYSLTVIPSSLAPYSERSKHKGTRSGSLWPMEVITLSNEFISFFDIITPTLQLFSKYQKQYCLKRLLPQFSTNSYPT